MREPDSTGIITGERGQRMRSIVAVPLIGLLASGLALAQFGGREGDVVIYAVSAKGVGEPVVVPATTVNTAAGFEIRDPLKMPVEPFGPDFPGEFFVTLHSEPNDSFRFVIQKEDLLTPHNRFMGAGKVLIMQGIDRLIIPGKEPIDLTAGLYAPFPQGVDFGPELPILEANSFLWTPAPFFPLIQVADPSFKGPMVPPDLTGNEYVLTLGQFMGIIPFKGWDKLYPNVGWPQGIDEKMVERDTALGATVRLIRIRGGRKTPPFIIRANTHLAVLSGSVQITPLNGTTTTLTKKQYAFVPNGFAITLQNPKEYTGIYK